MAGTKVRDYQIESKRLDKIERDIADGVPSTVPASLIERIKAQEVNMLKTNFKVDTLSGVARNGMTNAWIDVFNDDSGIGEMTTGLKYQNKAVERVPGGEMVGFASHTDLTGPELYVPRSAYRNWSFVAPEDAVVTGFEVYFRHTSGSVITLHLEIIDQTNDVSVSLATASGSVPYSGGNVLAWRRVILAEPVVLRASRSYNIRFRWTGTNGEGYFISAPLELGEWSGSAEGPAMRFIQLINPEGSDVLTSTIEELDYIPTQALLSAITTTTISSDSIVFDVSRDGGVTWKAIEPDFPTDLSDLPEGTRLCVRAIFTGTASLNAWGVAWV